MHNESFVLTVLPLTTQANARFHVSLHIAPRLTPTGLEEPLGAFACFHEWATAAKAMTFDLLSQSGLIAATPLRERIDPTLWAKVFPSSTPVRAPVFDSFANRQWQTFPAKTVHDIAALMPLLGTLFFPIDRPDLKPFLQKLRGESGPLARLIEQLGRGEGEDDLANTLALDRVNAGIPGGVVGDNQENFLQGNPWSALLVPLHAARRYYERPEAQYPYKYAPKEGVEPAKVTKPIPDFHERVAHLADQPELLRRLGLVIDVHVDNLAALMAATELHAHAGIDSAVAVIEARTPVGHNGSRLLTVPRTADWTSGRLQLGDTSKFAALAMDADGGGLKAERFIRSLPRMLAMAKNGDAGNVAPPALRSEGITIIRQGKLAMVKDQMKAAGAMVASASPTSPPSIRTEDVARGFRVEIWDDHAKTWFSPHRRLATAMVNGQANPVYTNLPERGMVQTAAVNQTPGVADSPLYLHEALFGWSGWSLSAPRPGPRAEPSIVNGKQKEDFKNPAPVAPADAITPVQITTRVEPGTLPRLRYGRSYMFRAWSVDLAGNSPGDPVPVGPAPAGDSAPVVTAMYAPITSGSTHFSVSADAIRSALGRVVKSSAPKLASAAFPDMHRLAVSAAGGTPPSLTDSITALRDRAPASQSTLGIAGLNAVPVLTGFAAVDTLAVNRISQMALTRPVSTFAPLVNQAKLGEALATLTLEPTTPARADVLMPLIAKDLAIQVDQVDLGTFTELTDLTVTPLVPFLRWDPVPPPTVVARHRFSIAESIHHLVIRSGVDIANDPKGGQTTTVISPAAFIAATGDPLATDFRATSERHIAAPKGSQHLNELHGRFDPAMGSAATPAQRRTMLTAALRDDGTLFDTEIVAADDPNSMIAQPGISLQCLPEVVDKVTNLKTLQGEHRGDPPPAGHYVVHDTDALALPWLPDPLAAGIALGMNMANKGSPLLGAYRVESTAAAYMSAWPAPEPYRLVLNDAAEASASVKGNVITIGLPAGCRLDMRLSSSLRRDELKLFAVWNLLPKALTGLDLYQRSAADGQFWALSPFEPISLVHAVPRPVLPPLNTLLFAIPRKHAETGVSFAGVIDVHAPSTDRINAEASWSEWSDDLAADGPVRENREAVPFHAQVDPDEDMMLLAASDETISWPGVGTVRVHRARHEFGDTRHRIVDYAFRATTRFREYFPPEMLASIESRSVVGAATQLNLPSSAAPPAPIVDSVIPLFRWDKVTDPGQPFGIRRRRRAGLRIYLQRPWYRTGDGEQLAIILSSSAEGAGVHASVWGSDPVWFNAGPPNQVVAMAIEDFYGALGVDKVRGPDERLSFVPVFLTATGGAKVAVLGYHPEYNPDRKLWFVDVAIEPAAAMWPFVRLVVARYQPNSLPGLELSPVVLCDFAQLPPERTMTVSRPDAMSVRVTVSGPAGLRQAGPKSHSDLVTFAPVAQHIGIDPGTLGKSGPYPFGDSDPTRLMALDRRIYAILEHREPGEISDLDWRTVQRQELSLGGLSVAGEFAWTGVLPIPIAIGPAEPGSESAWRVTVEEHEGIEGDPTDPNGNGPLVTQWRIIYADSTLL